jgi:cellulose biosynthesis protein BcsQ
MSRTYDALARAEWLRQGRQVLRRTARSFRVVTVTSNKGGVGKTTFALNLAVYLRAMREELPILVIGLDEQDTVERMFSLGETSRHANVVSGLRTGTFESAVRLGQYGIHYVPSSRQVSLLKTEVRTLWQLDETLRRTAFSGLVILDTKSDLEILTQNAVAASDLTVVVVKDLASLREADHLYALTDAWGRPRERIRVLLSLLDLRVKYAEGEPDILALLLALLRERGYRHFPTFISLSRAIEALYTNPTGRVLTILHGAPGSRVHRQMRAIAGDLLVELDRLGPAIDETREPAVERLDPELPRHPRPPEPLDEAALRQAAPRWRSLRTLVDRLRL